MGCAAVGRSVPRSSTSPVSARGRGSDSTTSAEVTCQSKRPLSVTCPQGAAAAVSDPVARAHRRPGIERPRTLPGARGAPARFARGSRLRLKFTPRRARTRPRASPSRWTRSRSGSRATGVQGPEGSHARRARASRPRRRIARSHPPEGAPAARRAPESTGRGEEGQRLAGMARAMGGRVQAVDEVVEQHGGELGIRRADEREGVLGLPPGRTVGLVAGRRPRSVRRGCPKSSCHRCGLLR